MNNSVQGSCLPLPSRISRPDRLELSYLVPPLLFFVALMSWVVLVSSTLPLLLVALGLGWTQIVNPCGLAHTCALTKSVRNANETMSWLPQIAVYTCAGCISAAVTGTILGHVGRIVASGLSRSAVIAIILVSATAVTVRELGLMSIPLPQIRRQTRARWFINRPLLNPACWGLDVGFTFLTWQTFSGALFLALVTLILGGPMWGAGIFCCYWLGRALPHWFEPVFIPDPSRSYLFIGRIAALLRPMGAIHAFGVAVAATSLILALP